MVRIPEGSKESQAAFSRDARIVITDLAWSENSTLTIYERAVAEVISRRFGKNGWSNPGIPLIARQTSMSERKAKDCIKVLCFGDRDREIRPIFHKDKVWTQDKKGIPKARNTYHPSEYIKQLVRLRQVKEDVTHNLKVIEASF